MANRSTIDPTDPEAWGTEQVLLAELDLLRPMPQQDGTPQEPATEVLGRSIVEQLQAFASSVPLAVGDRVRGFARHIRLLAAEETPEVSSETHSTLHAACLRALCLSGGGIRSASFCLGVLQAFARAGELSKFDYISTVSGGGFIGSWLSAWCARPGENIATVEAALGGTQEPKEVSTLRDFTTYLAPQSGLTSSDTWAGIATVLRNLLLNWLLFLPLFMLLVWVPKFTAVTFEKYRPDAATTVGALSSKGYWLLAIAAGLYFLSLLFTVRQLIAQNRQVQRQGRSRRFGSGPVIFALCGLLPPYIAACLASIVLTSGPRSFASFSCWTLSEVWPWVAAGAAMWGSSFLLASLRLNWLLLARLVAGAAFGLALAIGFTSLRQFFGTDVTILVILGLPCCFLAHMVGSTLFIGLSSRVYDHDGVREWSARAGGFFALSALGWTVYAALVLWHPSGDLIETLHLPKNGGWYLHGIVTALGGTAGIVGALFGKSAATDGKKEAGAPKSYDWSRIAKIAALLFIAALIFELSRLFDVIVPALERHYPQYSGAEIHIGVAVVLFAWTSIASWFINVNKFSLHAYYRNRLIRAYLGASNSTRRPSAFTGFDEADNLGMGTLKRPPYRPFHVVNLALNLVHGERLAWQERKASSFIVTPLAVGNRDLGYRDAARYGGAIKLGTAMAISGAAVSPNMGYHSSPLLGLLMTLFNVRLGWWLGNPRTRAWDDAGPAQSVGPFLMEMLGLTNSKRRFVYLSDGGHFENLGIYEMLRRRCQFIVAVDAGCDPNFAFEDLGNALRKARIDLAIEVEFAGPKSPAVGAPATRLGLINRPEIPRASPYCAIGTIKYPEAGNTGRLIYIKAAIHGNEPEDVASYAALNRAFPHDTTADQFFSESQFESYRRLGLHIGAEVLTELRPVPDQCG